MGRRGSAQENGARTPSSDLEPSGGSPLPLAPGQSQKNHLPFPGDKALFCCLCDSSSCVLCPEVLKLILCFACRLDRQDGERVKSQFKVGHLPFLVRGVFALLVIGAPQRPRKSLVSSWTSLPAWSLNFTVNFS